VENCAHPLVVPEEGPVRGALTAWQSLYLSRASRAVGRVLYVAGRSGSRTARDTLATKGF
jgi:hypothetical protein